MSDAEPVVVPRKLPVIWILAALLLLCLAWFLFQLFFATSRIVVSKETTFITEPLGPDGLPDFSAYILARDGKGVTPENNAAVLIWQATWPGELDQKHWLLMAGALGMKAVPTGQDSLVTVFSKSVREQVAAELTERFSDELSDQAANELLTEEWQQRLRDELVYEAMGRPWTSEQMPALAKWAKANQKPLDMLVEAAARPKYFSPSPSLLDGKDDSLIGVLLPDIQRMRSAVRALQARAMWHLGEGRTAEAWADILACFRLARHTSRDSTLVGQLVAIAIDGMACRVTVTYLQHDGLGKEEAAQILVDLQGLPPASRMAYSLDQGERLMYIDIVLRMAQGEITPGEFGGDDGGPVAVMSMLAIDWNHVLREGNRWYDRIANAARLPTYAQRKQELANIDTDLSLLGSAATTPGAVLGSFVSRRRRSQMISDILLSLFLSSLDAITGAEDRAITTQRLTLVAAALAVYRARQGEYPESLDELSPAILPALPLDLYTEKPFIYKRKSDGGYLLYSVFQNGVDDGGTNMVGEIINGEWVKESPEDFDYNASDLVIRVPEPPFKFPQLPKELKP
ncbi:MAG: hypothetical protein GXP26_09985 [Planctomycetes bacterium]|nr:hypothetical protein [Planctomycetota bacterium]